MDPVIALLQNQLIVSCQAYPGDPMRDPRTTAQMAASVVCGGAAAVRVQGLRDVEAVRSCIDAPIVGLVKYGESGVYITPTAEDALSIAAAGAAIVAIDGTRRPRPDGRDLAETITLVKETHPEILIMTDCGSLADARYAERSGADLIATTLAGYTEDRALTPGPDFALLDSFVSTLSVPVVAEGRIRTPEQAEEALRRGAFAVCVGTAITHPETLTKRFVSGMLSASAQQ